MKCCALKRLLRSKGDIADTTTGYEQQILLGTVDKSECGTTMMTSPAARAPPAMQQQTGYTIRDIRPARVQSRSTCLSNSNSIGKGSILPPSHSRSTGLTLGHGSPSSSLHSASLAATACCATAAASGWPVAARLRIANSQLDLRGEMLHLPHKGRASRAGRAGRASRAGRAGTAHAVMICGGSGEK